MCRRTFVLGKLESLHQALSSRASLLSTVAESLLAQSPYLYHLLYMRSITYTAARQKLAATMDQVCEDCSPLAITRTGKQQAVVMLSLNEYQQLEETAHLLRSPANAARLMSAIGKLARGKGRARKLQLSE